MSFHIHGYSITLIWWESKGTSGLINATLSWSVKASFSFQKTLILEESAVFWGEWRCSTGVLLAEREKRCQKRKKWSDFSHIWLYHRPLLPWKPRQKSLNMIGPTMGNNKKSSTGATNTTLLFCHVSHFGPCAKSLHTVCSALPERSRLVKCTCGFWFCARGACDKSPISTVITTTGVTKCQTKSSPKAPYGCEGPFGCKGARRRKSFI